MILPHLWDPVPLYNLLVLDVPLGLYHLWLLVPPCGLRGPSGPQGPWVPGGPCGLAGPGGTRSFINCAVDVPQLYNFFETFFFAASHGKTMSTVCLLLFPKFVDRSQLISNSVVFS